VWRIPSDNGGALTCARDPAWIETVTILSPNTLSNSFTSLVDLGQNPHK
jgi:hypothetical protein